MVTHLTGGSVADNTACSEPLHLAYDRYIEIQGERARKQKLCVPGLEPIHLPHGHNCEKIPLVPDNIEYKVWRASNMYFKHGFEVKRKGKFEGYWTDEKKWDRMIWSVPVAKTIREDTQLEVKEVDKKLQEQPADAVVTPTKSLAPSDQAISPVQTFSS
jgi:hypothetical protein